MLPGLARRRYKVLMGSITFSLFQAFRQWGVVRSKNEREKIKAREKER